MGRKEPKQRHGSRKQAITGCSMGWMDTVG